MCMFHIVVLHLNNTTTVTASSFLSHLQPSVQTTRPSVQIARKISFNSAALQLNRWKQNCFGGSDKADVWKPRQKSNYGFRPPSEYKDNYKIGLLSPEPLGSRTSFISLHFKRCVHSSLCESIRRLQPHQDQKEDHIPPVLRSLHWLPVNKDCWRFKKSQNTRLTCCHLTNHPDPSGRLRGRTKPKKQRSLLLLHIKSC